MSSSTSFSEFSTLECEVEHEHTRRGRIALVALWVAAVVVVVWVAGLLLEIAVYRYDFSEPKVRQMLGFRNQKFDILYFGNSLVAQGVSPTTIDAKLATASWNMALGGASILESEIQLRHFVAHNPKPRAVALGLYINNPLPPGVRASLYRGLDPDLKELYRDKARDLENFVIDRSFIAFNTVPAYRYRNSLDLVIKNALSSQDQVPRFDRGQVRVMFANRISLGASHKAGTNIEELRSFLEYCREHGIAVLLIEPPNTPGFSEISIGREAVLSDIAETAQRVPKVKFRSYIADPRLNLVESDWVNLNHLNAVGADKFSSVLAADLIEVLR